MCNFLKAFSFSLAKVMRVSATKGAISIAFGMADE
jgi:hypothetical protein